MCVNRVMFHCFVGLRGRLVSVHGMKACSSNGCVAPLILNLALMALSGQFVPWLLYPQHPLGGRKRSFCFWELNPNFQAHWLVTVQTAKRFVQSDSSVLSQVPGIKMLRSQM
jgi:hypothetical protein